MGIALVFAMAAFLSVVHCVFNLRFAPDSTNYLVASRHLLEHGRLFVWTNWPSESLLPEVEPYTEYPPGLPIYYLPFVWLIRDLAVAGLVAQATSVVLLFAVLYLIVRRLEFGFIPALVVAVCFSSLASFRAIMVFPLTETLFLAVSLALLWALLGIRQQGRGWSWWLVGLLIAISTSIKYMGVLNLAFVAVPILVAAKKRLRTATSMLIVSAIPIAAWFARNLVCYGYTTATHDLGSFRRGALYTPYLYFRDLLGFNLRMSVLSGIFVAIVCCLPLLWIRHRAGRHEKSTEAVNGTAGHKITVWFTLALGVTAHLLGIYVLSLISRFNELEHRLLSPTIAIAVILFAYGLQEGCQLVNSRLLRGGIYALCGLMFLVNPSFQKADLLSSLPTLRQVPERFLWEHVSQIPSVSDASHFYTDLNFNHQLFASMPHRIIWQKENRTEEGLAALCRHGSAPFFLVRDSSEVEAVLRKASSLDLNRLEFPAYGHVLYMQKPEASRRASAAQRHQSDSPSSRDPARARR